MSVWRVHFFKKCNNFLELDGNKVISSTLPQDLLEPGDFILTIRGVDIRGLKSVNIKKLLSKIELEKPLYFLVLKANSNPLYLQKQLKVSTHFTSNVG